MIGLTSFRHTTFILTYDVSFHFQLDTTLNHLERKSVYTYIELAGGLVCKELF